MKRYSLFAILLIVCVTITFAQKQKSPAKAVRVVGVVVDADDHVVVPYVNIAIAGTHYGTSADASGYFSIFINPGDTLMFSSIGFSDAAFVMPFKLEGDEYSLLQLMRKEAVMLNEVVVFPWPSLKNFEKAFLDTKPQRNMSDLVFEVQRDIKRSVDKNEQYEYYYDQMRYNRLYELHGEIPPNNFLNPIRWSNFIDDVRKGKFKGKKDPNR
ncbi:hypothetical protein C900_05471 [Fulvivirga imtechensis AK7]|uniref:TonB-dependent receptor n=1 Tax=Fulvivirga imtechensis AK7 TaxID=1237149 RepID=L8JNX5_9BACT|nr:carboxypeptidase-like regulatory domain-containing protein [Fulvivirga imtechensis]ELR69082.1 hypothetical protein C900_05471 [Fulvivirga imtechensis AK7]